MTEIFFEQFLPYISCFGFALANNNCFGLLEQGGLYISEVVHKAKIEVTEDGTKASGITGKPETINA